jgi:hypothetical protein
VTAYMSAAPSAGYSIPAYGPLPSAYDSHASHPVTAANVTQTGIGVPTHHNHSSNSSSSSASSIDWESGAERAVPRAELQLRVIAGTIVVGILWVAGEIIDVFVWFI